MSGSILRFPVFGNRGFGLTCGFSLGEARKNWMRLELVLKEFKLDQDHRKLQHHLKAYLRSMILWLK